MTTITQVTDYICDQLRHIDGRTSPWTASYTFATTVHEVVDRYQWLDDISNFPSVQCVAGQERVLHQESRTRWRVLDLDIRAFVYAEDTISPAEQITDDIEHVLSNCRTADIEDVRIVSITTDDGLNRPLGVALIRAIATYQR